jgi:trypsin
MNTMLGILRRQHASDTSKKLRLPFIIYCITILFQTLLVWILADKPVSANTVDPTHSHIPSKTVNAQIEGGTSATEGEFPYMAAIYKKGYLQCGGVILSSRWVLTSAYCMVNIDGTPTPGTLELKAPKSDYAIGYGSIRNETLNWVSISDVRIHPEYVPLRTALEYSLALLELATPLPSSGSWRPARITPRIVKSGDKLIAAGWGRREDNKTSSILQKIQVTAGSHNDCTSDVNWEDYVSHDGEFVCIANGRGRGFCYGDGGGPLVLPDSPDSDEDFAGYLVGIGTSMRTVGNPASTGCTDGNLVLNHFTRVARHAYWIASVMGVSGPELLAVPEGNELDSWYDEISASLTILFPMKSFDDTLLLMTLCLLALAIIAFNN